MFFFRCITPYYLKVTIKRGPRSTETLVLPFLNYPCEASNHHDGILQHSLLDA